MRCKFSFLFLLIVSQVYGQFPSYIIDIYAGDVQIVQPGKKPVPAKMRMQLFEEDKIVLKKDGAAVTIVDREQQYLVLNKKGNYLVKELKVGEKKQSSGITNMFFKFIWAELIDPSHGAIQKDLSKNRGGGHRGPCDFNGMPSNGISVTDKIIQFSWNRIDSSSAYKFSLFDADNNLQFKVIIRDTALTMYTSSLIKRPENSYLWQVESLENPCGDEPKYKFKLLIEEEYARQSEEVIKSVKRTDLSHYYLEISKELYSIGLFSTADEYFLKAVKEFQTAPISN